jgi:hypothetical protein
MFENAVAQAAPVKRATTLAITCSPLGDQPLIFELAPPVFDLLGVLENWTDRAAFKGWAEADELIANLMEAGLIEVSR